MACLNRIALVTGASKGIGKAIAARLASEGALVTIVARNQDALKQAACNLAETSGSVVDYIAADVSQPKSAKLIVDQVVSKHGRIDILVNNAGGPRFATLMDLTESRADSKSQHDFGCGLRITIASSALMSCITACMPARIDRNPASRNRLRAAVRSVAMTPAPLPR